MFIQFIFCLFLMLCEAIDEIGICQRNIPVITPQIVTVDKVFTELVTSTCTTSLEVDDYSEYDYVYDYSSGTRIKTYMCTKSKHVIRPVTKIEQKTITQTQKFCCEGYVQENSTLSAGGELDFQCVPICVRPCNNGHCVAPNRCSCKPGYTESLPFTCSPVCDLDCGHGTCIEPNTCMCDAGYELTNTTNHAICTKTKLNDTVCPHGYKEDNGSCKPQCTDGCLHGVCILPDVCVCDPGYKLQNYSFLGVKVCKPECNPGYVKQDGVCRPECKQSCGKGTCVRPNICECFQGYKIDLKQFTSQGNLNGTLCIPACKNYCPGECVAPNTCVTSPLLSPFTTPISTTSTRSTSQTISTRISSLTTIIPTKMPSIPTITTLPTNMSSIFSIVPKLKSTLTTDTIITTTRRPSIIPNIKSTATIESGRTTTRKPSTISSTTTTPYDPSNSPKNKVSTMTSQSYKSTGHMYEASSSTVKYKYENENKTSKEVDHVVTTNGTPPTTDNGRSGGPKTWLEQHWISVLLPIVIVLLAAVVMLLVWRRAPIIIFLRGRSYAVEDDVPDEQDPHFQYSKKKDRVVCKYEDM